MTYARREIFSPDESGFFHCISRCVRRAFLCGYDRCSRKSFKHRKKWIKQRLYELIEIFAIECLAYAVMSNHLHSILRNRPDIVALWSDREVARRWRLLFPYRRSADGRPEEPDEEEIGRIVSSPQLVAKYRSRLSDISWFNRCLNEHIARRANVEDDCSGRFWEGRFRSIRLETPEAVIACSVYVDLNPIRAGKAQSLEESDFTSIQDRIRALACTGSEGTPKLVAPVEVANLHDFTPQRYIELVRETGRMLVDQKHSLPAHLLSTLKLLGIRPEGWVENARNHETLFHRVMGPVRALRSFASRKNRAWLCGLSSARLLFA